MNEHIQGVTPSGPGLRPSGAEPATQSQAEPLVPNADWRTIETAPRCVPSGVEFPNDNGRRPVLVTRWPISGFHHPVAVARLTSSGWICGKRGSRLWFVPTHWMPTPGPPCDSDGSPKGGDARGSVHDSAGPKDIAPKVPS